MSAPRHFRLGASAPVDIANKTRKTEVGDTLVVTSISNDGATAQLDVAKTQAELELLVHAATIADRQQLSAAAEAELARISARGPVLRDVRASVIHHITSQHAPLFAAPQEQGEEPEEPADPAFHLIGSSISIPPTSPLPIIDGEGTFVGSFTGSATIERDDAESPLFLAFEHEGTSHRIKTTLQRINTIKDAASSPAPTDPVDLTEMMKTANPSCTHAFQLGKALPASKQHQPPFTICMMELKETLKKADDSVMSTQILEATDSMPKPAGCTLLLGMLAAKLDAGALPGKRPWPDSAPNRLGNELSKHAREGGTSQTSAITIDAITPKYPLTEAIKEQSVSTPAYEEAIKSTVALYTTDQCVAETVASSLFTMTGALERFLKKKSISVATIKALLPPRASRDEILDFVTSVYSGDLNTPTSEQAPVFAASSSSDPSYTFHFQGGSTSSSTTDESESRARSQHVADARSIIADAKASRRLLEISRLTREVDRRELLKALADDSNPLDPRIDRLITGASDPETALRQNGAPLPSRRKAPT